MSCFTCEECGKVAQASYTLVPIDTPPDYEVEVTGYHWYIVGNCAPVEVCPPPSFQFPCQTSNNRFLFFRPDIEGPQILTYRIHVIKENGVRLVHETFAFQQPYSNTWIVELPFSVFLPFIQGYEGFIKLEIYGDMHSQLVFFGGDITGTDYFPMCLTMKVVNAPFSYADWNDEQGLTVQWVPNTTQVN